MKRRSIAILAIVFVLALGVFAQGAWAADATDESYIQCAKTLVEKQLLAPSTAAYSTAQVAERDAYGRVLVTLSVDAQNAYGTPIRSYYAIVINSYNAFTGKFDYYKSNGIQEYTDTAYADVYIDYAKSGSYWNEPLRFSAFADSVGELDQLNYDVAQALYRDGDYTSAVEAFKALGDFEDAATMVEACNEAMLNQQYLAAIALYEADDYDGAIAAFDELGDYEDSAAWREKSQQAKLQAEYNTANSLFDEANYEEALNRFKTLGSYSDASEWVTKCENMILQRDYESARELFDAGEYEAAQRAFLALGRYLDATEWVVTCEDQILRQIYLAGIKKLEAKEYDEAIQIFEQLGTYSDAREMKRQATLGKTFAEGVSLYEAGNYEQARDVFRSIGGYADASTWAEKCSTAIFEGRYAAAVALFYANDYAAAKDAFIALEEYSDSENWIVRCDNEMKQQSLNQALVLYDQGEYVRAKNAFEALGDFPNAETYAALCTEKLNLQTYNEALALYDKGKYNDAQILFDSLKDFRDAKSMSDQCDYADIYSLYEEGLRYYENRQFFQAYRIFSSIEELPDSFWDAFMLAWRQSYQKQTLVTNSTDETVVAIQKSGKGIVSTKNEQGYFDISLWRDLVSIDVSGYYVVGLREDGSVISTYAGSDISDWSDITCITIGNGSVLGVKEDGTVVHAGKSTQFDFSTWKDVAAITYFRNTQALALKADGTLQYAGNDDKIATLTSNAKDIVYISGSEYAAVWVDVHGNCRVLSDSNSYSNPEKTNLEMSLNKFSSKGIVAVSLEADGVAAVLLENGEIYLCQGSTETLLKTSTRAKPVGAALISLEQALNPICLIADENGGISAPTISSPKGAANWQAKPSAKANDPFPANVEYWQIKTPLEANGPLPSIAELGLTPPANRG